MKNKLEQIYKFSYEVLLSLVQLLKK